MTTVIGPDGQPVEVSPDQATAAFKSGQARIPKATPVPVRTVTGKIGTVDPEHLQTVIEGGGQIVGDEEVQKAADQKKYGGLGSTLAAAGEGVARGLTVGTSDPLAVGAARLFGGDEAAEATRKHLESEQRVHPWASGAGELAGAALPFVLSEGASGAATAAELGARGAAEGVEAATALGRTGAEEANVMSRIGQGVRTLGGLPRGIGAAGDVAEHGVAALLGEAGETALGRAAQSAAKVAARGVVEGGLWNAGGAISDATLENKPLTAEKLFASVGHGALMGGLLGGALGGVGTLASEGLRGALGAASEKLDGAAGEQAYKWLDARAQVSREAVARAGGTEAVGQTVMDEVLKPLVEKDGLKAAMMDPEGKLEAVQDAVDRVGQQIAEHVQGNAHAATTLGELLKPVDDQMAKWDKTLLGEEKLGPLQRLRESVIKQFGGAPTGTVGGEAVQRTGEEVGAYLREHPDAATEFASTGKLPDRALFHAMPEGTPGGVDMSRPIGIEDMIKTRRALQDRVFEDVKALDPDRRVKVLREVSGAWNELEERVLNDASKESGELAGTHLRDLNKTFQQLKIAEQAVRETTARYASNRNLGLSEYLTGIGPGMHALLSGNVVGAAAGFGAALGHKALREHGNAYAALMLDRLSTMGGISTAVRDADAEVDRSIARIVKGGAKGAKLAPQSEPAEEHGPSTKRFEKARDQVKQLAAITPAIVNEHLERQTQPLRPHAPELANLVHQHASNAQKFLASKLPPESRSLTLTPNAKLPPVPANQRAAFLRYYEAVQGGPEKILQDLARGVVSRESIEVLQNVFPEWAQEARVKIATQAAGRKTPLDYQTRVRLSMLGLQTDPTLQAPFIQAMQATYATSPSADPSGTAQPAPSRAPAKLGVSKATAGPFELVAGGS